MENSLDNPIVQALAKLESNGKFYWLTTVSPDHLKLDICEVGEAIFPLTDRKIKKWLPYAAAAKFGFKDQTLLDKSVRDVLEIDKSQIEISDSWDQTLGPLLENIKSGLGLDEDGELNAELHNFLI